MKDSPQGPGFFDRMRNTASLLALACHVLAVSSEVFLRVRFGSRYLGMQAGLAALAIPLFGVFFPQGDLRPLFWFFLAYLGMCFLCRLGTNCRSRRGHREHSRYSGTPLLCWLLPRASEIDIKRTAEPLVVLAAGMLLLAVSPPLGTYLLLSAMGLAGSVWITDRYERQVVQNMYDELIAQRQLMERFRLLREDRHF